MTHDRPFKITHATGGAALPVRVVTRADEAEIVGTLDDGFLKIRLTASSAGEDAANQELISLLAARLEIPAARIEIVAGANGRDKMVSIEGLNSAEVEERLGSASAED